MCLFKNSVTFHVTSSFRLAGNSAGEGQTRRSDTKGKMAAAKVRA